MTYLLSPCSFNELVTMEFLISYENLRNSREKWLLIQTIHDKHGFLIIDTELLRTICRQS